jgi:hypothetical protein
MKHFILFASLIVFSSYSTIFAACGNGQSTVRVEITPDNYPGETSWSLRDKLTNALIDTGQILGDTICIGSSQCVVFTIFDAASDGLCCGYGQGSYRVFLNGNQVIAGGQFGNRESAIFNCAPGLFCTNPLTAIEDTMVAPDPDTWYVFVPDSSGTYKINTCALGNSCDTKLYMYPACNGITIDESNMGTIFYNDDACANLQSEIVAMLQAGITYYIRVGDFQTSCDTDLIRWQIIFQGPVVGCMDTASCNYNPMATISDGSCVYPPSPLCPAPDLEVVQSALETSMYADDILVAANDCYIGEGCLGGYGNRRLIRFTTHIKNIGDLDYYIGQPDTGNQFVYGSCHGHWHYEGYAEYLLYDQNFQPVQSGFKNGFCVLDLECSGGGDAKYGCGNMGISHGCGDIYGAGLSCQWIDITDVDTGRYTFIIRVNWDQSPDKLGHYEKRYDNNQALVCLHLYYDAGGYKVFDIIPNCAASVDCAGDTFGNAVLDCEQVCNGSHIRGDVNINQAADAVDYDLYLNGIKEDTLLFRTCIDLNEDSLITVTDAARLNGCMRQTAGNHNHPGNYQNTHKHCDFPFNIYNPFDSVTLRIVNVDWQQRYVDISVLNPSCFLLAYEFRMHGLIVDSVKNLALGNYTPDIRYSSSGHIVGISTDENALFKQPAPLNFLRVHYNALTDTFICIQEIVAMVNGNYEEVKGKIGGSCLEEPNDSVDVTSIPSLSSDNLMIVPNPTSGVFDLYLDGSSMRGSDIFVVDALGRKIFAATYTDYSNRLTINLTDVAAGIYTVQIKLGNNSLSKRLMVVDK